MREVAKSILTWVLSFFNVGFYYVRDRNDIDSILHQLQKFGLQEEAYELEIIYLSLIINESLKTLMMFLSLMCLLLANVKPIVYWGDRIWNKSKPVLQKVIRFLMLDKVWSFIKKGFKKAINLLKFKSKTHEQS